MVHVEKYDKNKTYIFQDGKIATYEILKELFNAIDYASFIVVTDYTRQIIISFELLDLKRTQFNIDTTLSEEQAIAQIETILNESEQQTIDDTTRIADALEDLVVLNMPDEDLEG